MQAGRYQFRQGNINAQHNSQPSCWFLLAQSVGWGLCSVTLVAACLSVVCCSRCVCLALCMLYMLERDVSPLYAEAGCEVCEQKRLFHQSLTCTDLFANMHRREVVEFVCKEARQGLRRDMSSMKPIPLTCRATCCCCSPAAAAAAAHIPCWSFFSTLRAQCLSRRLRPE